MERLTDRYHNEEHNRTVARIRFNDPGLLAARCNHVRFTDRSMRLLRNALASNSNLMHLDLSNAQLSDKKLMILSHGLRTNRSLCSLKLNNNMFSQFGMPLMLNALRNHPNLTQLWIGSNSIGDEGVKTLCHSFSSMPNLRFIGLAQVGMGSAAMAALAAVIRTHPTICEINLCGNEFSDEDIQTLCDAMWSNKVCRKLWLRDCKLSNRAAEILCDCIVSFEEFHLLNVTDNPGINHESVSVLGEILAEHPNMNLFYDRLDWHGVEDAKTSAACELPIKSAAKVF